ncbi:MAG: DUF2617 family protein [Proteobacteria bacterium]|nr:DUF2617 family protein [Pseudomonadota bacterium]
MIPVLQAARDLRLNLIEGQMADWSQFRILKAQGMDRNPWNVKAHVIGASHLISVNYNGSLFHEIFACMEVKADAKPIYYGPIMDIGNLTHKFVDKLSYKFDSKILKWDTGEPLMLDLEHMANTAGDNKIGLVAEFPPINTDIITKTIVLITMDDKMLKFETVHSYPNEDCIVFTQTRIKETL